MGGVHRFVPEKPDRHFRSGRQNRAYGNCERKANVCAILKELPDFEKGDRFLMNIVSCAMLAAFVLSMPERPDVTRLTSYYEQSMMTPAMRFY